ncbi:MAG: PQQ-like beta-propeller repeat protein [Planctomycetes bacterium]|nr:PQQ-like beta-propeller repeat protein [Planctomycetota bacterium]
MAGGDAGGGGAGRPRRPFVRGRWWPAGAIVVLAGAAIVCAAILYDASRQHRFLAGAQAVGVALILLLAWFAFLAPFPRRARALGSLSVLGLCLVLAALLRIRGVTGDLVPILELRWRPREAPSGEHAAPTALAAARPDLSRLEPLDYPGFLGPRRDATVRGVRLARGWASRPPREVWRRPVGAGWSSFAVAAGHAVTLEQHGEEEVVVCYALATGEVRWRTSYPARFDATIGGIGPRSTPTIDSGRVYAAGSTGILSCLDGSTGERLWWKDVLADNESRNNSWGYSASPLVLGDAVIASAGGRDGRSLVAYHKGSGDRLWSGGSDRHGYSSPTLAVLAGVPQVLAFNKSNVTAHDPSDGRVLWQHPWPDDNPNVAQPVPAGEARVLVTSGYGVGCALLEVSREPGGSFAAKSVWETRSLKSKFADVVLRDGFAYGLDDGILVCVDLDTGARRWKAGRYGHGQLLLVEDLLLVQAESGEVVLLEPSPEEHRELGRFEALHDKTWNHPAFRPPYLLVRNDREAACYELAVE